MKKEGKGGEFSAADDINYLVKVLGKQIEKFEAAYLKKDPVEFNSLKKEILRLQRRINGLVE